VTTRFVRQGIRWLLKWACPELFGNPLEYYAIDGTRLVHMGEFHGLEGWWQAPWQITLPSEVVGHLNHQPWDFVTFHRRRGSLDPMIYERLEQPPARAQQETTWNPNRQ
jgi:hypothetical protein